MSLNSNQLHDFILTSDLTYTSPNGRYSYRFNYLGNGVFTVFSKGTLDEKTFKHQLESGDKARERLKALHSQKKYHLIWDVSEVRWGSLLTRYMAVSKLRNSPQFESLTFIGANNFIRSLGNISGKMVPHLKLFFFKSFDSAIQNLETNLKIVLPAEVTGNNHIFYGTDTYDNFYKLWQGSPDFIKVSGSFYRIYTRPSWQYTAKDFAFQIKVSLIESRIVYFENEGLLTATSIDICYEILETIMNEMGFTSSLNKFYTIINLKKARMVSLGARKKISYYENLYKERSFLVVMVANSTLLFLFSLVQRLNSENFHHWSSCNTVDSAMQRIFNHFKGDYQNQPQTQYRFSDEELKIPSSPKEMIKLIRNQHKELQEVKRTQQEQIQKIIEIVGRMTWDETFDITRYSTERQNPYFEVYNSLNILFQDFQEIIHEKQYHTERLVESEDKYRNLINLANDIILVYQDDIVKFLNNRVEQVLGYRPEEVMGKTMDEFVAPEEIERLRDYHMRRTRGEEIPWIYETAFLHRSGHKVPISMSVGTIQYENKPAAMIIARDITQKKKTEEELEQYRNHLEDIIKQRTIQLQKEISERKEAEESDRLKTAFLSNMSHEIRTPMNAIISFSNFLLEGDISEEQRREYLTYIVSSGQSLLNLINDIIDISKIEARQLNIQKTHCNINIILEELYKWFEGNRKSSGKEGLIINLLIPDKSQNITLFTDPYRLKQILSNLLDNSLKFTDVGSISFGYELSPDTIKFFVKDTGIGIPEDKKEYIFKRFGKIENLHKNIGGTGLGLAISKHLSLLLDGELWVESQLGQGSTFYLKLPYLKIGEPIPVAPNNISTTGSYSWNGKRILIAEDEDLNFKVLQIALRKTNVEVIRAYNGAEALEIVTSDRQIDIILMDIQMPVMDGYEAMSRIKRIRPELPIIAQTAFALLEEQNHCIEMGFNDYISKPIATNELFQKMEALFASQKG